MALPIPEALHPCESSALELYDETFSLIYEGLYDQRLGEREYHALQKLFRNRPFPQKVLDAAAGTGAVCMELAGRGCDVTANELSPDMRRILERRGRGVGDRNSGQPHVLEPGVLWRNLPKALPKAAFDLAICVGAALSHCDSSPQGTLKSSLWGMVTMVREAGFLVVDCKHYADDGWELLWSGARRAEVDTDDCEWTDPSGSRRKGVLTSRFELAPDRTLLRTLTYDDADSALRTSVWKLRTWPVDRATVCDAVNDLGLKLVAEHTEGQRRPFDFLLFSKVS